MGFTVRLFPATLAAVFALAGCDVKQPVRETVLPGVSMVLPWGGLACDPAVGASLGGRTLSPHLKATCARKMAGAAIVAMYPIKDGMMFVAVADEHAIPFPPQINSDKPQDKEAMRIRFCRALLPRSVSPYSNCETSRMTISGRTALLSRSTGSYDPVETDLLRAVAMPYRGGMAFVMLAAAAPAATPPGDAENAAMDAMIASIELDSSVK